MNDKISEGTHQKPFLIRCLLVMVGRGALGAGQPALGQAWIYNEDLFSIWAGLEISDRIPKPLLGQA